MRSFGLDALPAGSLGELILQAAEASGVGVVVLDSERIRYANPAAEALLGIPNLTGQRPLTWTRADDIPGPALQVVERLLARRGDPQWEAKLAGPEGRSRAIEIQASRLAAGEATVVVALMRDVSERDELREQVSRAEKLASLGTLAAGVAHEINNPLTFMTLGIGLVATRLENSSLPEAEKGSLISTLSEVRNGADRVADIVRELSSFARVDSERRELVDLESVVGRARRIVAHRARHVAEISVELQSLPALSTDPGRLEQVLVNLLINAAQALEAGGMKGTGRITVRAELLAGARVQIDVSDNGPGIEEHIKERIFDPFFTTKPVGEGTGLGLSVCHGIATQLGGRLSVESRPGCTTFRLEIPLRSALSTAPPPISGERLTKAGRLRVLVIDDDPTVLQAIKRSAQREHEVTTAGSGQAALDRLRGPELYDIVLCDLAMPEHSGMDVYQAILRDHPRYISRFVLMTGGAPTPQLRGFLDSFSGPRLLKPFSLKELGSIFVEVHARAV